MDYSSSLEISGRANDNSEVVKVESVSFHRSDDKGDPGEVVDGTFFTTDPRIHAHIVLNHELVGSYGRVQWPENYEIVSCKLDSILSNVIDAHAGLPREWPVGKYEVRLYIKDKLIGKFPFSIVEPK